MTNQTTESYRSGLANHRPEQPKREPEVQRRLAELEKVIATIQECWATHCDRLSSAISQTDTCPQDNMKEPTIGVPLAERIRAATSKLETIRSQISDITERIEL